MYSDQVLGFTEVRQAEVLHAQTGIIIPVEFSGKILFINNEVAHTFKPNSLHPSRLILYNTLGRPNEIVPVPELRPDFRIMPRLVIENSVSVFSQLFEKHIGYMPLNIINADNGTKGDNLPVLGVRFDTHLKKSDEVSQFEPSNPEVLPDPDLDKPSYLEKRNRLWLSQMKVDDHFRDFNFNLLPASSIGILSLLKGANGMELTMEKLKERYVVLTHQKITDYDFKALMIKAVIEYKRYPRIKEVVKFRSENDGKVGLFRWEQPSRARSNSHL